MVASSAMERRTYGDPCGVARALDAIGERWALLVVRELLLGPKRFSALHRGLGAASQNVLAQRLRELEARRHRAPAPAGAARRARGSTSSPRRALRSSRSSWPSGAGGATGR